MKNLKLILFGLAALFSARNSFAQATVTSTEIDKENRQAVMIQIDQSVDVTTSALEQRLERSGLDGKTHGGVTSYKGVTFSEIGTEKVDIYTKVEKGDKNNTSVVYLAVSKGYDNFTGGGSDNTITENVKTFLNSFVNDVNIYLSDVLIAAQMKEVETAQKEYERSLSDQKDLQKKKSDDENNITDKDKEINEKKADLDRKKEALEDLKRKRGGLN
jgi:hypothetical protein